MPYRILYAPEALAHLKGLPKPSQRIVVDAVDEQLLNEPLVETRRRKPLRPNPVAPWELRIGDLRVFYDVDTDAEEVLVVAVGVKSHNVLTIGGEEIEL